MEINKITIEGINLKSLLKDEFVAKLDENIENYTIYSLTLILDGEKPSELISLIHELKENYKANELIIGLESEEMLIEFLKKFEHVNFDESD